MNPKGKGLIRAAVKRGARADKSPPAARQTKHLAEPSVCQRCGAVYSRRTWRQRPVSHDVLAKATWVICPACKLEQAGEYYGRVRIRGAFAAANDAAIRRRIRGVAARARITQPQRRLVSVDRDRDVLEVLTTSQKLAHRIVHELKKTFRGRAAYHWSADDGSLIATWERDAV